MTDIDGVTLRIGADPSGVAAGLNRASSGIDAFGARTRGTFSRLDAGLSRVADRAISPMTSALTGGGIAVAIKSYNDLETSMIRMSNQAGWSRKKQSEVFQEIMASSKRTGIPVDELIAGMARFVDKTGDADMAVKLLGDTATAAQATGSGFSDMGAIASQLSQKFNVAGKDLGKWFEVIGTQGDMGAFTMNDFATQAERFFSAAASGGGTKENLRAYLALIQVAMQATGDSDRAMTSFESMLSTFRMKAKDIQKLTHFSVFDDKGNMKSAETILKALYTYTGGSQKKLAKFGFDIQGLRMIQEFLRQRKETGGYEFFDKLEKAAPQAETMSNTTRKFERVTESGTFKLQQMRTVMLEIVNTSMAGPIEELNKGLSYLAENEGMVKAGFYGIAAAAGLLGTVKLGSMGRNLADQARYILRGDGQKAAGIPGTGTAQGLAVQRVYVVNMGPGTGGGYYGDDVPAAVKSLGDEAGKAGSRMGTFRAGLNKIGSTDLGFGALAVATSLATAKIMQAAGLTMDLIQSRGEAGNVVATTRYVNNESLDSKYGIKVGDIGRRLDKLDDAIAEETDSFFPDAQKIVNLQRQRADLFASMRSAAQASKSQPKQDAKTELNQAVQIFIDQQGRATAEVRGSLPAGGLHVSTLPWKSPGTMHDYGGM